MPSHKHTHRISQLGGWLRVAAFALLIGAVLFQAVNYYRSSVLAGELDQARARLHRAFATYKNDRSRENSLELKKALTAYRAAGGVEGLAGAGLQAAPVVGRAVNFAVTPRLKDLPELDPANSKPDPQQNQSGDKDIVRGKKNEFPVRTIDPNAPGSTDPVVQRNAVPSPNIPSPGVTFAGLNSADNVPIFGGSVLPPDTVGDVGPNHYIQAVNAQFGVYAKTGTKLVGGSLGSLFASLPGGCANNNSGDPIVLYDPLADRWQISQFCIVFNPNMHQIIAVSKTSDPTGQWYLYDFVMPNNKFHDYPHYGVWPDAYYMTVNQFNQAGTAFLGAGAFAFDRKKMLAGDPAASFVYFDIEAIDPTAGGMLPTDIDGVITPPVGTPNLFMMFRADEFGDPADAITPYEFHADFVTPANSTFTTKPDVPIAAIDARNPAGRNDIEQPGTTARLDSIADRLMHRLAYRNLGTPAAPVNSYVLNFTVNVSGVNPTSAATYQAGIRWTELRRNQGTGAITVNNEGTYAPGSGDGATGRNIWMGSLAQDYLGNLALGFSASSATLFPSIVYAGRLASDPAGQLAQGEATMQAGAGSQTSITGRWGDYSAMSVDPVDETTFWYTQQYYAATSAANWVTRVGSFKVDTSAPAQSKGTVTGTITNCLTNAPIPNAVIMTAEGFFRQTDASGNYSMSVAPGTYTVMVSAPGYGACTQTVTVGGGETGTASCCLQPQPVMAGGAATITAESCSPANGAIDPGETVTISFCAQNNGPSGGDTANLIGALLATGGVTSPSGPQNYGVVTAGGPAVCRDFTFTASAQCGGTVTASLQFQDGANNLGTLTYNFAVGTLNPTPLPPQTYSSGNLALAIPDQNSIDVPLTVADSGAINDVNVLVRLNHTFDGDLKLSLIAPDNTVVALSNNRGSAGDNYGTGANDCSGTHTIFDDQAASTIASGAAPFAGSFKPETPLSALNGKNLNGTWKLRVEDTAALDTGTIGCFQLQIVRQTYLCCGVAGTPAVAKGPAVIVTEGCSPGNGAIDPAETVSVDFTFLNAGDGPTTNLVATLQSGGGVTPITTSQNYGVIAAGASVTRNFSFSAAGVCGSTITATFQLQDGATNFGNLSYTFNLGTTMAVNYGPFSNSAPITIPAGAPTTTSGVSAPYPSNVTVSGVTAPISGISVTLSNVSHTFPDDIDVLLVGPGNQKFILMADAGGGTDAAGSTWTFTDSAGSLMADAAPNSSGTYRPTNYLTGDAFAAPAPPAPYDSPATAGTATLVGTFGAAAINGAWSLYVVDDLAGDTGAIAGGWSISFTSTIPVCCGQSCSIIPPANITAPAAAGQCGASVAYPPPTIVTGDCGAVTCSPPSGSFFPVGTTTVTCSADQGPSVSFTVTITDTQAPAITCPANQTVATTGSSAVVSFPAPAVSDNCPGVTAVCTPPSGSVFPVGVTTVNCKATDASNNMSTCSFSVGVNRAGFALSDPLACTGPGNTVTGASSFVNNGAAATTVSAAWTLPAGLVALPGGCAANTGSCIVVDASTITYNATLNAGQTANVTYQAQVGDLVANGTVLTASLSASFGGGPALTVSSSLTVTCPSLGPGGVFPPNSVASDQKAGSVLFYNIFTSSPTSPATQNTRINLTNVHPTLPIAAHLYFVDGANCSVADSYICLTPNQTVSFVTSDFDPGTTGYIVVVASSLATGCPVDFNYLIGDEYVKFASGHTANLAAESISALAGGQALCDSSTVTATLPFDGISYNRVPRALAASNIPSRGDGNDTMLVLNRFGGNLGTGTATLTAIFGILYDDAESPFSFSFSPGLCQFRGSLSSNFPRTTPRFDAVIPPGRTGWMRLYSQSDIGLFGAMINLNQNAGVSPGAFNQGHNLHKLTLTPSMVLTVPIFPPSC